MTYVSGKFWEAQSIVFYEVWRLLGGPDPAALVERVGPPKETRDRIFGSSDLCPSDLRIFGSSDDLRIFDCWRFGGVLPARSTSDGSADCILSVFARAFSIGCLVLVVSSCHRKLIDLDIRHVGVIDASPICVYGSACSDTRHLLSLIHI